MEPRYNKPLYGDVLGLTNDFLYLSDSYINEKKLDITKPRYSEHILGKGRAQIEVNHAYFAQLRSRALSRKKGKWNIEQKW